LTHYILVETIGLSRSTYDSIKTVNLQTKCEQCSLFIAVFPLAWWVRPTCWIPVYRSSRGWHEKSLHILLGLFLLISFNTHITDLCCKGDVLNRSRWLITILHNLSTQNKEPNYNITNGILKFLSPQILGPSQYVAFCVFYVMFISNHNAN